MPTCPADVQVVGAVDQVHVSRDLGEIAGYVGTRTVYSLAQIEDLGSKEVLVLLSMTIKAKGNLLSLKVMRDRGVVKAHPQTIQSLPKEHLPWLLTQLSL
jgi:hypothetical protein